MLAKNISAESPWLGCAKTGQTVSMTGKVVVDCLQQVGGYKYNYNWSERSACAARAALQTGCVANKVATKFVVFLSFFLSFFPLSSLFLLRLITFLPEGVVLGS